MAPMAGPSWAARGVYALLPVIGPRRVGLGAGVALLQVEWVDAPAPPRRPAARLAPLGADPSAAGSG